MHRIMCQHSVQELIQEIETQMAVLQKNPSTLYIANYNKMLILFKGQRNNFFQILFTA